MDSTRRLLMGSIVILLLWMLGTADSVWPADKFHPSASRVISDLKEAIAKKLGVQSQELKIVEYEFADSLIGESVAYELELEADKMVFPLKIVEDVKNWRQIDSRFLSPIDSVLEPFDLSGPVELWIKDGHGMRLALPNNVDAGEVKKVILSDGATVTVQGAKAVILRHPIDLPSFPNATLSSLGHYLRHSSTSRPHRSLVSLRIVGPSSLTASRATSTITITSPPANNPPPATIKVKRVGPGQVHLSSPVSQSLAEISSSRETPTVPMGIWPLPSLNASDPRLAVFEEILTNVITASGKLNGSPSSRVRLTRAEAYTQTFVKMSFGVERNLEKITDEAAWEGIPAWRTWPTVTRMHFEVLARLDGDVLKVEMLNQVQPYVLVDSSSEAAVFGNITRPESLPISPPSSFTL